MGQHATIHGKTTEDFNGQDGKWIPIRVSANGGMAVSSASPDDIVNVYETAPAGYDQQQLAITVIDHTYYQAVGAGATDVPFATIAGAAGDRIAKIHVVVTTGATGTVSVKDGGGAAIPVAGVVAAAYSQTFILGWVSKVGGWTISTGAGVTAVISGRAS